MYANIRIFVYLRNIKSITKLYHFMQKTNKNNLLLIPNHTLQVAKQLQVTVLFLLSTKF